MILCKKRNSWDQPLCQRVMSFKLCVAVISLFYILICLVPSFHSHCNRNRDCESCTQDKTWSRGPCNWCELDRACHAKWSPRNQCLSRQNIRDISQCVRPKKKIEYDPNEAYRLALFSATAYSDEPRECLEALYPDKDYEVVDIIMRDCDDFLFEYDKQCLALITISKKNKEIIVAYRGTRGVKQILDQALIMMTVQRESSEVGGEVESYFNNVHKQLYPTVKRVVKDLTRKYPDYNVKFTGHSLGGAVASIQSAMVVKENIIKKDKVSLYTYGMPRVGNKIYAEAHDQLVPDSWRVVRKGDSVTRMPFCSLGSCALLDGPYHHKTKVLYEGNAMTKDSNYVICMGNEDSNSKCRKRRRTKRGFLDDHKIYFSIPIGTYCRDNILADKTDLNHTNR